MAAVWGRHRCRAHQQVQHDDCRQRDVGAGGRQGRGDVHGPRRGQQKRSARCVGERVGLTPDARRGRVQAHAQGTRLTACE